MSVAVSAVVSGAGMAEAHRRRMPSSQRFPHPRHTLSRLQAEWLTLRRDPDKLAAARRWALPIERIDSLDDVLAAAGLRPLRRGGATAGQVVAKAEDGADERAEGRPSIPGDPDGDVVLASLLVAARTHPLAARVVLQRLLPGLSALARQRALRLTDHLAAFDELLSAAWGVIREFPVERRSHHLAAALLRDCAHQAFRKHRRRLLVHELTETHLLDRPVLDDGRVEPLVELCEVIVDARAAHLDEPDLILLRLLLSGWPLEDVAREMSISPRTVRNRRHAVLHRLRAAVAASAA